MMLMLALMMVLLTIIISTTNVAVNENENTRDRPVNLHGGNDSAVSGPNVDDVVEVTRVTNNSSGEVFCVRIYRMFDKTSTGIAATFF